MKGREGSPPRGQVHSRSPPSSPKAWPDRCAPFAHQLHEGLQRSSLGEEEGKDLLQSAKVLAELLDKDDTYHKDFSEQVDKLFADAAKAGVVLAPKPDVPGPPAEAQSTRPLRRPCRPRHHWVPATSE